MNHHILATTDKKYVGNLVSDEDIVQGFIPLEPGVVFTIGQKLETDEYIILSNTNYIIYLEKNK